MHTKAQLQSGGEGHRRRGVASIRTRRILGKVGGATFSGGGEAEGERRQQGGRERWLDGRPGAGERSRVSGAGTQQGGGESWTESGCGGGDDSPCV
jgi:hypothetical protein